MRFGGPKGPRSSGKLLKVQDYKLQIWCVNLCTDLNYFCLRYMAGPGGSGRSGGLGIEMC